MEPQLLPIYNPGTRSDRRQHSVAVHLTVALVVFAFSSALTVAVLTLHLGVRPVLTGSMRPDYGPGALLVTRRVPLSSITKGMIVLFVPPGEHAEYAHRVTSVSGSPEAPVITTKGDANLAADQWHARISGDGIDEVIASAPEIGRIPVAIRGSGQILLAFAGAALALWGGLRWLLGGPSRPSTRGAHSKGG